MGKKLDIAQPMPARMIDGGKLQPQAVELEEAVLGAMMLDGNCIVEVLTVLNQNSWYKEAHQYIFGAIKTLFDKNDPVDILTVTNELKRKGNLEEVGGPYYISKLTDKVASGTNAEYHSRIIQEKFVLREIIRLGVAVVRKAYDETADAFELEEMLTMEVVRLSANFGGSDEIPAAELYQQVVSQAEAAAQSPGGVTGIPSGFRFFDKQTGGLHDTDLVIIAGRPGMGKTAAVLSMILHQIIHTKYHIVFFSLEMSSVQLMARLVAMCGLIEAEKLKKGAMTEDDWKKVTKAGASLCCDRVHIYDDKLTLTSILSTARRKKNKKQCDIVYVDYMQLVSNSRGKGSIREQEVSEISREMKLLAKALKIPVLALSQLNRSLESRGGDKRPMLSDLRESGAIEQDADVISFIYRPEYYNIFQYENGESTIGVGEIITAKNRHGPIDSIKLQWLPKFTLFQDFGSAYETEEPTPLQPSDDFEPRTQNEDDGGVDIDKAFNEN